MFLNAQTKLIWGVTQHPPLRRTIQDGISSCYPGRCSSLLSAVALEREHAKSKVVNKRDVIHQKQAPDAAFLASAARGSKQLDVRPAVWTLSLFPSSLPSVARGAVCLCPDVTQSQSHSHVRSHQAGDDVCDHIKERNFSL